MMWINLKKYSMIWFNLDGNYINGFVWAVNYDIWPMRFTNYIHEVNEWYAWTFISSFFIIYFDDLLVYIAE